MAWKEDYDEDFMVQEKVKMPKDYKVYILNDDVTSIFFVRDILKEIFHIEEKEAWNIISLIQKNGSGLVGVYPKDIAYTKQKKVHERAAQNNYPLKCVVQE